MHLLDGFKEIFYKRRTNAATYDIYTDMIVTFSCKDPDNILGTDFDIYSNHEDALKETHSW